MMPAQIAIPAEPAPGTVIGWQQQFAPDGPVYTYVAIHIAGRGWFVSDDSEAPYTWAQLCVYLIRQSPVSAVTGWGPLR